LVTGNITGIENSVVDIYKKREAIRRLYRENESEKFLHKVETMFRFRVADDVNGETEDIGCNCKC
jgi:hypothetical protein